MRSILIVLLLAGCAPKALVDLKTHPDPVRYQDDLIQCHTLAEMAWNGDTRLAKELGQSMVTSAVLGTNVAVGGFGAVIGYIVEAHRFKSVATAKCLHGRGHYIINREDVRLTPKARCVDEEQQWPFTVTEECLERHASEDVKWAERFGHPVPR